MFPGCVVSGCIGWINHWTLYITQPSNAELHHGLQKKIRLIQHLLDQDSCEVLVCILLPSHLDYGNGLPFSACDNVIKKFQHVQSFAVKSVLKDDLKSSSIGALHKLHWLPIRAHINFKIILMYLNV